MSSLMLTHTRMYGNEMQYLINFVAGLTHADIFKKSGKNRLFAAVTRGRHYLPSKSFA